MKHSLFRPRALLVAAIVLTLAFIFGNSLLSRETSLAKSDDVAVFVEEVVHPVVTALAGRQRADKLIAVMDVRKIAHFVEFFVLGALTLVLARPLLAKRVLGAIYCCWTVAFLDESIQMLTGRGPAISDVWLDLLGAMCGMALLSVILAVLRIGKRKKARADDREG